MDEQGFSPTLSGDPEIFSRHGCLASESEVRRKEKAVQDKMNAFELKVILFFLIYVPFFLNSISNAYF